MGACALNRNDSVRFGDRGRLARIGRRRADQIERTRISPNGVASRHAEAIGGTPMAATETVALPVSIESFRLSQHYESNSRLSLLNKLPSRLNRSQVVC